MGFGRPGIPALSSRSADLKRASHDRRTSEPAMRPPPPAPGGPALPPNDLRLRMRNRRPSPPSTSPSAAPSQPPEEDTRPPALLAAPPSSAPTSSINTNVVTATGYTLSVNVPRDAVQGFFLNFQPGQLASSSPSPSSAQAPAPIPAPAPPPPPAPRPDHPSKVTTDRRDRRRVAKAYKLAASGAARAPPPAPASDNAPASLPVAVPAAAPSPADVDPRALPRAGVRSSSQPRGPLPAGALPPHAYAQSGSPPPPPPPPPPPSLAPARAEPHAQHPSFATSSPDIIAPAAAAGPPFDRLAGALPSPPPPAPGPPSPHLLPSPPAAGFGHLNLAPLPQPALCAVGGPQLPGHPYPRVPPPALLYDPCAPGYDHRPFSQGLARVTTDNSTVALPSIDSAAPGRSWASMCSSPTGDLSDICCDHAEPHEGPPSASKALLGTDLEIDDMTIESHPSEPPQLGSIPGPDAVRTPPRTRGVAGPHLPRSRQGSDRGALLVSPPSSRPDHTRRTLAFSPLARAGTGARSQHPRDARVGRDLRLDDLAALARETRFGTPPSAQAPPRASAPQSRERPRPTTTPAPAPAPPEPATRTVLVLRTLQPLPDPPPGREPDQQPPPATPSSTPELPSTSSSPSSSPSDSLSPAASPAPTLDPAQPALVGSPTPPPREPDRQDTPPQLRNACSLSWPASASSPRSMTSSIDAFDVPAPAGFPAGGVPPRARRGVRGRARRGGGGGGGGPPAPPPPPPPAPHFPPTGGPGPAPLGAWALPPTSPVYYSFPHPSLPLRLIPSSAVDTHHASAWPPADAHHVPRPS
jgi:hypothetical protein